MLEWHAIYHKEYACFPAGCIEFEYVDMKTFKYQKIYELKLEI